jgi:hypothetical protein
MPIQACPRCGAWFRDDVSRCPADGEALEERPDPLLGKVLGRRYRIVDEIGAGGMGTVFRARHVLVGRDVAIKLMSGVAARDPNWRERLLREAQTTNLLKHENIVDITDFGDEGGAIYLVMELLEGETLEARLRRGPFSSLEALDVALPVTAALARAHELDVVHRDIKPSNIFLSRSTQGERVKVLDFGIARVLGGARLTATGAVLGTPEYMSPEQAIGGEVGPASDLYSLGVVLFEALAGRLPFLGSGARLLMQHAFEPAPDLADVAPGVPADLVAVVMRLLAKVPGARFPDAHALMAALAAMRPAAVAAGASLVPPPRSAIDACRQRAAQLDAKTRERFGDAAPPEVAALEQNLRVTLEQLQRSVEEGTGVAAALVATDERRRSTISRIGGALDVLARDASLVRQRLDDARSRGDAVAAAALESEADDLAFQMQALRGRLGAVEADLREELAAQEPRADDVATRVAQAEDTFTAAADALARAVG